jgi:hypothetical protein
MMDEAGERKHHYTRGHDDGKLFAVSKCKEKLYGIIHTYRQQSPEHQYRMREGILGLEWALALTQEVEAEFRKL